jgi:hypothetical protein
MRVKGRYVVGATRIEPGDSDKQQRVETPGNTAVQLSSSEPAGPSPATPMGAISTAASTNARSDTRDTLHVAPAPSNWRGGERCSLFVRRLRYLLERFWVHDCSVDVHSLRFRMQSFEI